MASISGEFDSSMEGKTQEHIQWNHNVAEGCGETSSEEGCFNQDTTGPGISRTTSSKKCFRQGFLNWVAFERSLSLDISDRVKRTCPIAECEKCLESELQMRQHLKGCSHLRKGYYRCHESNEIERIGKCETRGCRELRQYKSLFSNAMHNLGRRLSPRGRPSRLVDKISKKYTKAHRTSEEDSLPSFDRDSPFSSGLEKVAVLPEGVPRDVKRTQYDANELDSYQVLPELPTSHGRFPSGLGKVAVLPEGIPHYTERMQHDTDELDSYCDVPERLPSHDLAELVGSSRHDLRYLNPAFQFGAYTQLHIPELDNNFIPTSQCLVQGTYRPVELPTTTDLILNRRNSDLAQNTGSKSCEITRPDDIMIRKESLSRYPADYLPVDGRYQHTSHTSIIAERFDYTSLVSPMDRDYNMGYLSTCAVSPVEGLAEAVASQGDPCSSTSPSHSTTDTSLSATDSINTPADGTSPVFLSLSDELDCIFEDPALFEDQVDGTRPLLLTKNPEDDLQKSFTSFDETISVHHPPTEGLHVSERVPNHTAQNASISDSKQNVTTGQSPASSSDSSVNTIVETLNQLVPAYQIPQQSPEQKYRIPRKPVASSSSENNASIQRHSFKRTTRSKFPGKPTPYKCNYCLQRFTDKSNLKRHIKCSCKKRPGYTPDKNKRPFKCDFYSCQKRFTQNYNLLAHQKTQCHQPPIMTLPQPQPLLPAASHTLWI